MKTSRTLNWVANIISVSVVCAIVVFVVYFLMTRSTYKHEWKPEPNGTERVMRRLPSEGTENRCGDYFVVKETKGSQGTKPYIKLAYPLVMTLAELERFGNEKLFVGHVASIHKFNIVIDDSKLVPTDQVWGADRGFDRIIIRISQADYDKAPCLKQIPRRHE